jgi:hypothetical protein
MHKQHYHVPYTPLLQHTSLWHTVAKATIAAHFVAQGMTFKINNDECVGTYRAYLIRTTKLMFLR